MHVNADFSKPAIVIPQADGWVPSPEAGVERLMLDRIGDEVARATSLVRYAPRSSFAAHRHSEGEEFLVLDGVFSDEAGDYPAGTYVRNPPGSGHSPRSAGGCRIFVKLRQMKSDDDVRVVTDTTAESAWQSSGDGMRRLPLHAHGDECVEMRSIDADRTLDLMPARGGAELLVVSGEIDFAGTRLTAESWLRIPDGYRARLIAADDTVIWLKTGHLPAAHEKVTTTGSATP